MMRSLMNVYDYAVELENNFGLVHTDTAMPMH